MVRYNHNAHYNNVLFFNTPENVGMFVYFVNALILS